MPHYEITAITIACNILCNAALLFMALIASLDLKAKGLKLSVIKYIFPKHFIGEKAKRAVQPRVWLSTASHCYSTLPVKSDFMCCCKMTILFIAELTAVSHIR